MRELNVNEIEAINGGYWQYVAGWAIGHAIDYALESYNDHLIESVENGWRSNPEMPPAGAGFGTL
ncbi:MAG: hypothetical protein MK214_03730 [Thalassotalea sp.]|nr:hypothetical protein [Thalassotalea sp.]